MSTDSSVSIFSFLRSKFHSLSLRTIAYLQLEAITWWIVAYLPALPGFVLRDLWALLFLKGRKGMIWLQPNVTLVHANRFSVGTHCGVNSGTYINAVGGVRFGNYVLIGSNVTISSGEHPIEGTLPPIFSRSTIPKEIVIEDDVWLGAGAVILPGVTLRKGTVVGANAVVTKDTEPYSVVVGVPARHLRFRKG